MASASRFRWIGNTGGILSYLRKQKDGLRLTGSDGQSFGLRILGYEFPAPSENYWDENWLFLQIDATHPTGSWSVTDPSLLTFEIGHLADWLEAIDHGLPVAATLDFVEPNLVFRYLPGTDPKLRVYFQLEVRPMWARVADDEEFWVEFVISELNLELAVSNLRAQAARFPERHSTQRAPTPRSGRDSDHRRH